MGFWDSLIHGAADVASWLGDNAGSIFKAVSTVAEAAGLVALEQSAFDEDNNCLHILTSTFDAAEQRMEKLIKHLAPAPIPATDSGNSVQGYRLTGVWPAPSTDADGLAQTDVSADVNRFLCLQDIPTEIDGVDVGKELAAQMFTASDVNSEGLESPFKASLNLNFDAMRSLGFKVTGSHLYYQLPIGNTNDDAWHSYTQLWVEKTPSFHNNWQQRKKVLSVKPRMRVKTDSETPYNMTTLSIKWMGTENVGQTMANALNTMNDSTIYYETPCIQDGTTYQCNFHSPVTVGPAAVKQAMNNAVCKAIPTIDPSVAVPLMPDIQICSSKTIA